MASKEIELTQGKLALVDAADYERLSQFKWCAHFNGWHWYAQRRMGCKIVRMHNDIMEGLWIDHRNGNGLDNRRENLRVATCQQNGANRSIDKDNKCGYKGVWRSGKRFAAQIRVAGKKFYLGSFDTTKEAAYAYDEAARNHFGEFARCNFTGKAV